MIDPETNKSKGFGFVEYENEGGVMCALRVLHDVKVSRDFDQWPRKPSTQNNLTQTQHNVSR